MSQEKARIIKSHDIRIDNDYADWIAEVKHRYRSSQVKAAVKVNAEKLLFNWQLGRDLVQNYKTLKISMKQNCTNLVQKLPMKNFTMLAKNFHCHLHSFHGGIM